LSDYLIDSLFCAFSLISKSKRISPPWNPSYISPHNSRPYRL
jgi:hypothetical protein